MEVMGSLTGLEMLIDKTIEKCLLVYDLDSEDTEDVLDDLERTWPEHPASRTPHRADANAQRRQDKHVLKDYNDNTSEKIAEIASSRQTSLSYITVDDVRSRDDAVEVKRARMKQGRDVVAAKESVESLATSAAKHELTSGRSVQIYGEPIRSDVNSGLPRPQDVIETTGHPGDTLGQTFEGTDTPNRPVTDQRETNDVRLTSRQDRGSSSSPELNGSKNATSRHAKLKSRLQQRYLEDSQDGDVVPIDAEVRGDHLYNSKDSSEGSTTTCTTPNTDHVDDPGLARAGSAEVDRASSGNLDLLARAVNISILRAEQVEIRRQQEWAELEITRHFIGDRAVSVAAARGEELHRYPGESHVPQKHGSTTPRSSPDVSKHVSYMSSSNYTAQIGRPAVASPEIESHRLDFGNASDHVVVSRPGVHHEHIGNHTPISSYDASKLGSYVCYSSKQSNEAGAAASSPGRTPQLPEPVPSESDDDLDRRALVLLEHYQKGFHAARESVRGLEGVFSTDQSLPKIDNFSNSAASYGSVRVDEAERHLRSSHDAVQASNSNTNSNSSTDSFVNGDKQTLRLGGGPYMNDKLSDAPRFPLECNSINSLQELILKQERLNHQGFEPQNSSFHQKISENTQLPTQALPRASRPCGPRVVVEHTPPVSDHQRVAVPSPAPKTQTSSTRLSLSSIILEELQRDTHAPHDSVPRHSHTPSYTPTPISQSKLAQLISSNNTDSAHTPQSFQPALYTPQNTAAALHRSRHTPTTEEQRDHGVSDSQRSSFNSLKQLSTSPVNFVHSMSVAHAHCAKPSTPSHLRYPLNSPMPSHERPMSHDMPTDLSLPTRKRSSGSRDYGPVAKSSSVISLPEHTTIDLPTRIPPSHDTRQVFNSHHGREPPGSFASTNSEPFPRTLSPNVSRSKGEFVVTHIAHGQNNCQIEHSVSAPRHVQDIRPERGQGAKLCPDMKLLSDKRRMAALARWTEARNREFELQRDYT